jgi:phage head maturation protease
MKLILVTLALSFVVIASAKSLGDADKKPLTQEELQALLIGVLPVNFPNINEQSLENVQDRAILTSLGVAAAVASLISNGVNLWGQYFSF